MSNDVLLAESIEKILSPHPNLDDDTLEYISSLLTEDIFDPDAREAVSSLIEGSVDEDDDTSICTQFFQALDANSSKRNGDSAAFNETETEISSLPRKLDNSVTLKERDVTTFASGLVADDDDAGPDAEISQKKNSTSISNFYANMIDVSSHPRAVSERDRRKQRQRELRLKLEEEERERALKEEMDALSDDDDENDDGEDQTEDAAGDNASNVKLFNFDLPNLRGGGPDLLSSANMTLSSGRRYGLMGRNGCGKTTLMTYLAHRKFAGGNKKCNVPKNMSMLLVRQELVGGDLSAVEEVLRSDVRKEGLRSVIKRCEEELDRIERGEDLIEDKQQETKEEEKSEKKVSSSKQKLRDRKKNKKSRAAKTTTTSKKKKQPPKLDVATRKATLMQKLTKAHERLAKIEEEESGPGGNPESRARKVLIGLGFTEEMQERPTKELSGGWRMRVSLSCALFANPSLLLLDEPTNHLDLEAVLWLERYLTTKFTGTLLLVSHDRHFLNETITDVLHFHSSALTHYRGDISNFEAVRLENRNRQIRLREAQEAKRAHLQKYIDLHAQSGENGVKAAKQRKSRMKKLDKLGVMAQEGKRYKSSYDGTAEEVEEVKEEEEVTLTFPDPGSFDGTMISLEQASFGYSPEKLLLQDVDLTIDINSRIALLGRNGCGKSTLIQLLIRALQPKSGKASVDPRAKIEYLAQHQLDQLDPDSNPLQTMLERYPGDGSDRHLLELRRYLAGFGLGGEVLPHQIVKTMSGGQKCRLCLACAMYRRPHLLVLDEPTNHLDLETTAALIEAIRTFRGGVLLVSHDQHLITSVCDTLYVLEGGMLGMLRQGTSGEAFEAYKKAVIQGRR